MVGCKGLLHNKAKSKSFRKKTLKWLEEKAVRYEVAEAIDLVTGDFTEKKSACSGDAVSMSEGKEQAARMGAAYYEVNVWTDGPLIEEIFHEIVNNLPKTKG
ncbi:MAG: hypothetical protein ACFFFG_17900 [Candidatus Thorarchaeota archaeon]